jgi:uncharacterized protein YjbJ (UPF0337 family)
MEAADVGQDERDGKIDRAKGKVKEVRGDVMHENDLKAEGLRDGAVGNVEESVAKVRCRAGQAIKKIKNAASRG